MSITTRKLSNGDWIINNGERAWVTNQEDNTNEIKLTEDSINRSKSISNDFGIEKEYYAQVESDINDGTLLPEQDTDDYLYKHPDIDFVTSTLDEIVKYKEFNTNNQNAINDGILPGLRGDLELFNEIDTMISEPPDDAEGHSIDFEPSNQQIPNDGTPLDVMVTFDESGIIVKYISVTINVNHPSPGTEKLKVMLHSPEGTTRQLWYQDFESSNDEQTIETSYFNNENISGEWVLTLIQDVTTDTNVLNSASIMIYY